MVVQKFATLTCSDSIAAIARWTKPFIKTPYICKLTGKTIMILITIAI